MMRFAARVMFVALLYWYRLVSRVCLRALGLKAGAGARMLGLPIIQLAPSSEISIGENTVLCSKSRFTALGVNHPVVLRTLRPHAQIRIGNDSGLSGTTICAAALVEIGDCVLLGANVTVADTDFHPLEPEGRRYASLDSSVNCAPVRIENNVFVGTGSIILKGVTIGENSVIGAGSVVSSNVPANSIAAGNPCRVLRSLRGSPPPSVPEYLENGVPKNTERLEDSSWTH